MSSASMEDEMDLGGLGAIVMDVVSIILLGAVLIWAVFRVRSRGKSSSPPTTESATDQLYDEEEKRRREGTDGL